MRCRSCDAELNQILVDLGVSPLSNSYLPTECLSLAEIHYPLKVYVCSNCWLAQLPEFETPDALFADYAYFSSYSESWLQHAETYVQMIMSRLGLNESSQVVELASNDGYLLQYFVRVGIPVLGVEPAANVAEDAIRKGIPTIVKFFGAQTARELVSGGKSADLLLGNNVLAHVPDLNDFITGMKLLLKPTGVITLEFPHLERLIELNQFDTIYHEHFSYFSLISVESAFRRHGLTLFDIEELPTHGGSLRIYGRHSENEALSVSQALTDLRERELRKGLTDIKTYRGFDERVKAAKRNLLAFLIRVKREGKTVAGYGAPAKGNTLLNYCGIRTDFLDYTVDRSPHKQGRYLPGTRIPVYPPEKVLETKPDYLLILPWNLKDEIVGQMAFIREWGGRFVVPIPEVEVLP